MKLVQLGVITSTHRLRSGVSSLTGSLASGGSRSRTLDPVFEAVHLGGVLSQALLPIRARLKRRAAAGLTAAIQYVRFGEQRRSVRLHPVRRRIRDILSDDLNRAVYQRVDSLEAAILRAYPSIEVVLIAYLIIAEQTAQRADVDDRSDDLIFAGRRRRSRCRRRRRRASLSRLLLDLDLDLFESLDSRVLRNVLATQVNVASLTTRGGLRQVELLVERVASREAGAEADTRVAQLAFGFELCATVTTVAPVRADGVDGVGTRSSRKANHTDVGGGRA